MFGIIKIISIATKRPEVVTYAQQIRDNAAASVGPHYDPLTVIVLEERKSNHNFAVNKPYLIVNGKNYRLLHENGKTDDTRYSIEDKPRLATDEEIEDCLTNLSAAQLRKIMNHELFAPIVHRMYEAETELVVEKETLVLSSTDKSWYWVPKEAVDRERIISIYREKGWTNINEESILTNNQHPLLCFRASDKTIGQTSNPVPNSKEITPEQAYNIELADVVEDEDEE